MQRTDESGLGQRLRELREGAGLSQLQLARLTGVSRNAVSQWESGQTQPSSRRLTLLSRALGVAIDQLMVPTARARERILEAAMRLLGHLEIDEVTVEEVCASADLFASKDDLVLAAYDIVMKRTFSKLRSTPPMYGTLATRLKYLLRHFYAADLAHLNLARAVLALSWRWSEERDRERARHTLEFHDTIIALFDEAAAQGQIDAGNYRAASALILAAYQLALRKAIYDRAGADRLISLLEPQLTIILNGFNYRLLPGLAEE
jgi:transcriptional regulator with XRE-family HTH domain